MREVIKIGTRKSELALKQAHTVGKLIESQGGKYEIIAINSEGDLDLKTPLHQLGFTGVFTKVLDIALLEKKVDIAVHSLKDVPTLLPKGIVQAAVLKRDNPLDILVKKRADDLVFDASLTIATGSIRRKAQWLHKYPHHQIEGLRGNVNTRLKKLEDNKWDGAIFSHSGLDRIDLIPANYLELDWMVSAPAQGIVAVTVLESNQPLFDFIHTFNHTETDIISTIERDFLNELEGGCTAPIGAMASIENNVVDFKGMLTSTDGTKQIEITEQISIEQSDNFGRICAQQLLEKGGKEIMSQLNLNEKAVENKPTVLITRNIEFSSLSNSINWRSEAFISINYIHHNIPELTQEDTLVFTSKNAVESLFHHHPEFETKGKQVLCVGTKTKKVLTQHGVEVEYVSTSSQAIGEWIVENNFSNNIVLFCGDIRRNELKEIIERNQLNYSEIVVYNTHLTSKHIDNKLDGVVFLSPSAVQSFVENNNMPEIVAFCIGNTTANEAKKHFSSVEIAKELTMDSVIEKVTKYYADK